MEILVSNRNFGQTWQFWFQIGILVKHGNFGKKINILVRNGILGQKFEFRS